MSSVVGVRQVWAEAAAVAADLIANAEVAAQWRGPSALSGKTVGWLASHLGRGVLQVGWFLDADAPGASTLTAVDYFARLRDTTDPTSDLNVGVTQRAQELAARGPAGLAADVLAAVSVAAQRLSGEPPDRCIEVLHRPGEALLLDEYLKTRCVELAVHVEDLALSVGSRAEVPPATRALAVDVLFEAARARHGDAAVLRAMARRERDHLSALRVL